MTTIIAGSFQQQDKAQTAMAELARAGFPAAETTLFFVNPPGQHDRYPIGGDASESSGTHEAPNGTAAGAAVGGAVGAAVGIATLPVLGPAAAVAGAGIGAYTGSLYGALNKVGDATEPNADSTSRKAERVEPQTRKSGVLVAVCARAPEQQASAIRILRAHGAADIERVEGTITGGQWADFNPITPITPVAD
jgi:hypothetical protein